MRFVLIYDHVYKNINEQIQIQKIRTEQEEQQKRFHAKCPKKKEAISPEAVNEAYEALMRNLGEPIKKKSAQAGQVGRRKKKSEATSRTEHSKALQERQRQLKERRILGQKENFEKIVFLQQRAQSTFDKMYTAYQELQNVGDIDPRIFDGSPKFVDVQKALVKANISVTEHIHGNEQCVALWKDVQNKKHMFWFHKPHGAQDKKGEDAGWCRGLEKNLRETGMISDKGSVTFKR